MRQGWLVLLALAAGAIVLGGLWYERGFDCADCGGGDGPAPTFALDQPAPSRDGLASLRVVSVSAGVRYADVELRLENATVAPGIDWVPLREGARMSDDTPVAAGDEILLRGSPGQTLRLALASCNCVVATHTIR